MFGPVHDIIKLFAFCKGGNFNVHIWAWFDHFICKTGSIYNLLKNFSCLGCANMHAFHENPNHIHTELTFINP